MSEQEHNQQEREHTGSQSPPRASSPQPEQELHDEPQQENPQQESPELHQQNDEPVEDGLEEEPQPEEEPEPQQQQTRRQSQQEEPEHPQEEPPRQRKAEPEPEPQPQRKEHGRRQHLPKHAPADSEEEYSDYSLPRKERRRRKQGGQIDSQEGQKFATENLPHVSEMFPEPSAVTGPMGGAVEELAKRNPIPGEGPDDKDTLKLRLDLNLDVAVEIKARVHGDVTLSLLN